MRTNGLRVLALGWCLMAVALGGCSESPMLSLDLRTDLRAGVEIWSVVVDLYRGQDTSVIAQPPQITRNLPISTADDGLVGIRILELPLQTGPWVIHARLFAGSSEVGSRVLQLEHDAEQVVTMVVTRRCSAVDCSDGTAPRSCRAGGCVDPRCRPSAPESCPSPECTTDADCGTVGCVAGVCIAGECGAAPDDARCGGATCDRAMGCLGSFDGGLDDGGLDDGGQDAGQDGGPPDAGTDASCVSESDSVHCTRLLATCGPQIVDSCGVSRMVDCGACSASARCERGGCVACASGGPCVTTSSTDFERGMAGASVDGVAGWSVPVACGRTYDEAVVDDGTGNLALRVSNAITTECFDQIYSPCPAGTPIAVANLLSMTMPDLFAGESSTGSTYRRFVTEFRFRSATMGAQDGLRVEVSAVPGSGDRQSLVVIRDTGSGFDIEGDTLTFAAGLSYTDWHTLRTEVTFVEGDANDTVQVIIDGTRSTTTATTFEELYRTTAPEKGNVPVQCLLLRVGLPDVAATLGQGLLVDDVQTWLETP